MTDLRNDRVEGYEPERPESFFAETEDSDAAEQLVKILRRERAVVDECDNYFFGRHPQPYMPTETSPEYKELARRSITNMIPLVIGNLAQLLNIEGYLPSQTDDLGTNAKVWEAWEANRMGLRQRPLIRAVLRYGAAYSVQEAGDREDGLPTVRIVSPSRMVAGYEDPANDERPLYALELLDTADKSIIYKLYRSDGTWVELEEKTRDNGKDKYYVELRSGETGLDHCPVVRHTYDLDIDGRYVGEINQIKTLQDRLNQTVMDRLLVQTFGSWKIRTISGIAVDGESDRLKLSKSRFLVAEDQDTKFGSLPETALDGFIRSSAVDQETISSVSSIPPHYLTGELNNLGAEAIAEARASMEAKAAEIKNALSESVKQMMRDLAELMGLTEEAKDYGASVVWHDAQNRSLSQVADALGKLATMLRVPVQELWSKIPGVTRGDVKRWTDAYEQNQMSLMAEEANQGIQEEGSLDAEPQDDNTPT
jgi:hypothetical protein